MTPLGDRHNVTRNKALCCWPFFTWHNVWHLWFTCDIWRYRIIILLPTTALYRVIMFFLFICQSVGVHSNSKSSGWISQFRFSWANFWNLVYVITDLLNHICSREVPGSSQLPTSTEPPGPHKMFWHLRSTRMNNPDLFLHLAQITKQPRGIKFWHLTPHGQVINLYWWSHPDVQWVAPQGVNFFSHLHSQADRSTCAKFDKQFVKADVYIIDCLWY